MTRVPKCFAALALIAAAAVAPVSAQEPLPPAPVALDLGQLLDLAEQPWLDRAAFLQGLQGPLSAVTVDRVPVTEAMRRADPWLWSIVGRFGTPLAGTDRPGGIVVCARYGVDTRDRLAATPLSGPEGFLLFGATLAAPDDASVWPEEAVARLSCMLTWDDARRVAIVPRRVARDTWQARFGAVSENDDAARRAAGAADLFFGPEGYRVAGGGGGTPNVVLVESAMIERRPAHQRLVFRSFLLGGGA